MEGNRNAVLEEFNITNTDLELAIDRVHAFTYVDAFVQYAREGKTLLSIGAESLYELKNEEDLYRNWNRRNSSVPYSVFCEYLDTCALALAKGKP